MPAPSISPALSILDRFRGVVFGLLFAPMYVSLRPIYPDWDDAFYLRSSVCVAREFWAAHWWELDRCLMAMPKSPIMGMLLIPGGPGEIGLSRITIAPYVLALLIAAFVLLLAHLTKRAGVPFTPAIIAAVTAISTPALFTNGAPFMVDGLLSVVAACTFMLPLVEWNQPAAPTLRATILRGALWALLLTVGISCKATYLMIAILLAPIAIVASWRRGGPRQTWIELTAMLICLLPVIALLVRYGKLYLWHAERSSFGSLAPFFDDGLSWTSFLLTTLTTNWPLLAGCLVLTGLAWLYRADNGRIVIAGALALVIIIYLLIAAESPNKDPRFFWMVWFTLPFCVAASVQAIKPTPSSRGSLVLQVVAVLVIAIPAIGRLHLEHIRMSTDLLDRLPSDRPVSLVLMTDDHTFNNETVLLAQQLDWKNRSKVSVSTVVYDITAGISVAQSIEKLKNADFVAGQFIIPPPPGWSNKYISTFEKSLSEWNWRETVIPGLKPITLFQRVDTTDSRQ